MEQCRQSKTHSGQEDMDMAIKEVFNSKRRIKRLP